mgnify:CR=1 FL=1
MGSQTVQSFKVLYVEVTDEEADALGVTSDDLLQEREPLVAVADYSWDTKDGEERARWAITFIGKQSELANYRAYMRHCAQDGIVQGSGWSGAAGFERVFSEAWERVRPVSSDELRAIGYEVASLPKSTFGLLSREGAHEFDRYGERRVALPLETDENARQLIVDCFACRVQKSKDKEEHLSKLMWVAQPWKHGVHEFRNEQVQYPMPEHSTLRHRA